MFYVYIIKSLKDEKLYIGYTADLKTRFKAHNNGKVVATKHRKPFELVYYEAFKHKEDASRQEIFYKTGQGRRILKQRLKSIYK